jgi:hypothetical protein
MNRSSASSLCLACGSVLLLGLAFVFLPWAWNLLPLVLLAVVLGILWARRGCPPVAPARDARMPAIEPPVQMTGGSGLNGNPKCARRANRAFGPIAAGLIIDLVDSAPWRTTGS